VGRFAQVGRNLGGKSCQKVPFCRDVRRIEPVSPIASGPVFTGLFAFLGLLAEEGQRAIFPQTSHMSLQMRP
jgi:hypothetical protein